MAGRKNRPSPVSDVGPATTSGTPSDCQTVACLNRRLHFHDIPSLLTAEMLQEVFRCDLTGWPGALPAGAHSHAHGEHHG